MKNSMLPAVFGNRRRLILGVIAIVTLAGISTSQPRPREQVGILPDGGFLLNSGWRVKAAGTQIPLDTLPMSAVLSNDGRFLLVLNGGYNPPSISVLDVKNGTEIGRTPVPDAWLGLALSPNGRMLWVGGGSKAAIYEFSFDENGKLQPTRTFELVHPSDRTYKDFIGDVAVSPDGRLLYACDLYHDSISVVNPQSGMVIDHFKTGRRPYRIMFHPDGKSFFVTSWADGTMLRHQTDNGFQMQSVHLGAHPTDMVWRDRSTTAEEGDGSNYVARIFVSAANTNNVYAVAVPAGNNDLRRIETINVSATPHHPLGMTHSALALSADKNRLFVVCSDANAAAVVDVTEARSHVLGFIPTGWYPTAAKALADGRLVILNSRGSRSYPNPHGPNPTVRPAAVHTASPAPVEYVGHIQTGSASIIAPFNDEQLRTYTAEVMANSPYRDEQLDVVPNDLPAIEHILYIVKENRTYDQVLGDLGKGESDPSLCIFQEKVSPNHHKLAREFVLFDNFYVNGDVSGDGHNWSTSAIANDYVVKLWPNSYAKRRNHYDYEGGEPAALPPANYLWTNAAERGISMRNYGYWATNIKTPAGDGEVQVQAVRDPVLARVTNMTYRGFDLEYPDVKRAQTFLRDLAQFENSDKMPALMFMRLGNDHTNGTTPGKLAPLSSFADNDFALGMIVEGISRSKFWKSTAIFVLEDDAQNGPDHIDSHRSPAYIISAYTHTGTVDSTMYNTTSMLRTMELILHMRPMTHFDAGARPMFGAFSKQAVTTAYEAEKPRISLEDHNPQTSATAARSSRMDFSEADLNDDDELNDILWRAIRHTEPPAPTRSLFGK